MWLKIIDEEIMKYVIEKGIPIPATNKVDIEETYPFNQMTIGECFLVADKTHQAVGRVVQGANRRYKEKNIEFISRKVNEGIRVWRIK